METFDWKVMNKLFKQQHLCPADAFWNMNVIFMHYKIHNHKYHGLKNELRVEEINHKLSEKNYQYIKIILLIFKK